MLSIFILNNLAKCYFDINVMVFKIRWNLTGSYDTKSTIQPKKLIWAKNTSWHIDEICVNVWCLLIKYNSPPAIIIKISFNHIKLLLKLVVMDGLLFVFCFCFLSWTFFLEPKTKVNFTITFAVDSIAEMCFTFRCMIDYNLTCSKLMLPLPHHLVTS